LGETGDQDTGRQIGRRDKTLRGDRRSGHTGRQVGRRDTESVK
jgi:hypothetical protein